MDNLISEQELLDALNSFRSVLNDFDFSDVQNIIFFNTDSLFYYIKNNKDNPFERQFNALEKEFEVILPYIPTIIPEETVELITKILEPKYKDKEFIQKNITFNMKLDFINMVKGVRSEKEWKEIVKQCLGIRKEKTRTMVVYH